MSRGPIFELLPGKLYFSGTWQSWTEERCVRELRQRGIVRVVNLGRVDDRWLTRADVVYSYHLVRDSKYHVADDVLSILADECVEYIAHGSAVLSMCYGGRNRSALLAGMIMRRLTGLTGEEVVGHVLETRPAALANELFRNYLRGLS